LRQYAWQYKLPLAEEATKEAKKRLALQPKRASNTMVRAILSNPDIYSHLRSRSALTAKDVQ